jgi:hypothetical protein
MTSICELTLKEMRGIAGGTIDIVEIMHIPLIEPLKRPGFPKIRYQKLVRAVVDGMDRYFMQKPLKDTDYRSIRYERAERLRQEGIMDYSYTGGN